MTATKTARRPTKRPAPALAEAVTRSTRTPREALDDDAGAARHFRRAFRALGSPARAKSEKAYLKSSLNFFGVPVPVVRAQVAAYLKENGRPERDALRLLVTPLLTSEWHELRSAGIALLERSNDVLDARDAAWLVGFIPSFGGWAHVDWLATKVLGPIVERHPKLLREVTKWSRDDDMWIRRTAILVQCDALRRGAGDFDHFVQIAVPRLEEREFFIRKAIGWILREVAKRQPERTFAFLRDHGANASGLTFREASRNLPTKMQAELARAGAMPSKASSPSSPSMTKGSRRTKASHANETRIGETRVQAGLLEVLSRGPVARHSVGELRGYLDYLDHAIYSDDEIAAMFDALVASKRAVRTKIGWRASASRTLPKA